MEKPYDLMDKYAIELALDTDINPINLADKQFSAPNTKHKWLHRSYMARRRLADLEEEKEELFRKKQSNFAVALSKAAVISKFEKDEEFIVLNKEIKKQEMLVEYLDKSLDLIYKHLTYDFRGIIDRMKLEVL